MRPFRFAVQALKLRDRDAAVTSARQAESLGYQELYSYDHLGHIDPFIPLVVAAEATSRLRVGTLVLNNELHHPALLARTVATADRMTGGRVILGIGTGYSQAEHRATNIELRPPGRRVERLEESLLVMRSLLDHGSVDFHGRYHDVHIADLRIRPVQNRVPFLVGGNGRRLVRVAGHLADIFQFTGLTHGADGNPEPGGFGLESVAERAHWLSEAAGERDADIERSLFVQRTVIGDKAAQVLDEEAQSLGLSRELLEETPFLLIGTADRVVEKLRSLRESFGISHVVVREPEDFAPVVEELSGR